METQIIDLRSRDGEAGALATMAEGKGIRHVNFPLMSKASVDAVIETLAEPLHTRLLELRKLGKEKEFFHQLVISSFSLEFGCFYLPMVSNGENEIKQVFRALADPATFPAVICCSQGKDRTGIMSALILAVLGVSHEDIIKDYELSLAEFPRHFKELWNLADICEGEKSPIWVAAQRHAGVDSNAIRKVIQFVMEKGHHSMIGYLQFLGLENREIEAIQMNLINF